MYNFNSGWYPPLVTLPALTNRGLTTPGWTSVSLPHTWNETDTYRALIRHSSGDIGEKMFGIGWYRKHFKLPTSADGQKVFLAI